MKDRKNWTYDELVEQCVLIVLRELMSGNLRSGVSLAIQVALQWKDEITPKQAQKK